MIKVLSIFGTRPEAIKMAPLVKALEDDEQIKSIVCITAQHREMLDQVIDLFKITPDYDLNIMSHGQTIIDIISKSIYGIDEVIKQEQPDLVLVHGDTTTTFAGAKVAFLNRVKVGHVEAGLRSFNKYSPFPEEMNRRLTGVITDYHFAPTKGNEANLINEGIDKDKIYVTGNTVIDALLSIIDNNYKFPIDILNEIDYNNKKVILLTCHRRENWGQPMIDIFNSVLEIVESNDDVEVIFPMHLNPKIRQLAKDILGNNSKIHLIEPLEYAPFANLINKSYIIMTDSGGIQEEAPALGKPVLVLRTETERPEAVEEGTVKIIGIDKENIVNESNLLLNNKNEYDKMSNSVNPYGDGKASSRIVKVIKEQVWR